MTVKYVSIIGQVRRQHRERAAEDLNVMVEVHVDTSQQSAPVNTGYLRDHILITEVATPEKLRAAAESQADYSAEVNFGHTTADGTHVPGTFFWDEGIEAARRALETRAAYRRRGGTETSRRGVETLVGEFG